MWDLRIFVAGPEIVKFAGKSWVAVRPRGVISRYCRPQGPQLNINWIGEAMTEREKAIVSIIIGLPAVIGLFWSAGWKIAVCILLMLWAENILRH